MVRAQVRNRISRDSVAKTMYEINRQPWELEEQEDGDHGGEGSNHCCLGITIIPTVSTSCSNC